MIELEFVVHAETADRVAVLEAEATAESKKLKIDVMRAKVDVKGLAADRPVGEKGIFEPAAGRPAALPVVRGAAKAEEAANFVPHVPVGPATGGIEQRAIEGIAETRTHRAEGV